MGTNVVWKRATLALPLILSLSAVAKDRDHVSAPEVGLSSQCQWMLLKSARGHGRSPYEVTWKEFYTEVRRHAAGYPEMRETFPEIVSSDQRTARSFGRLTVPQQERLLANILAHRYRDYVSALQTYQDALRSLQLALQVPGVNRTRIHSEWTKVRRAEDAAVESEQHFIAYTERAESTLGEHTESHLKAYPVLHLRPEYSNEYLEIAPPTAELMITMAARKHVAMSFSQHALEQSDLRGYTKDMITQGLREGKVRVVEARPEDAMDTDESLRFKVNITDFVYSGRNKNITLIVKFVQDEGSASPFRMEIITTWNQNMRERFKHGLEWQVAKHAISLTNKKFRGYFKSSSYGLLHDLTFYEISDTRARFLIRNLVANVGAKPAAIVLKYTLSFIEKEMPKAQVVQTVKAAYRELYNESL